MIELLESRDLFSATFAVADTEAGGGTSVAMEKVVIVHEGISRQSSAPAVSEITVTKLTDCASTNLFR